MKDDVHDDEWVDLTVACMQKHCIHRRWQLIRSNGRDGSPLAICCGCLLVKEVTPEWLDKEEQRWAGYKRKRTDK